MTPIASALLGLVFGAGLGTLTVWLMVRRAAKKARGQIINRHHLAEILAPLHAAVIVVSESGRVMAASDMAKELGLVRGSSVTRPELVALLDARSEGPEAHHELHLQGVRGEAVLMEARTARLSNGAAVIIAEDRSGDLRFSETRRDFVANISHELKTPIGAIGLLAEASSAAADDPVAVRRFMETLRGETVRLNELVSQIIALSRLQSEDPMLDRHDVQIAEVIDGAAKRCREQAQARQITVSVQSAPGLWVRGDTEQVETAVTNLVHNAIAYSEPGARVALTAGEDSEGMVVIRVSDNGIGISEEDQKRIFERFYRVDADRSRESGGTGLGLSIVKHVAAAHSGDVTVWSRLGHGSTFTLRLPITRDEDH